MSEELSKRKSAGHLKQGKEGGRDDNCSSCFMAGHSGKGEEGDSQSQAATRPPDGQFSSSHEAAGRDGHRRAAADGWQSATAEGARQRRGRGQRQRC